MLDMPRPRPQYAHREVNRHGNPVWYFRKGKGKRVRLDGQFGTQEWRDSYDAALRGSPAPRKAVAPKTSIRWLVDRYLDSGRFSLLAAETQEMRRRVLLNVCETAGDLNFRTVTDKDIRAGKVRREATPAAAHNYVRIMRALFAFAVDNDWVQTNPALAVKTVEPETDGHHTWTLEEVERYQAVHKIGTQARLAIDILLYTGFRRGDAVLFGKQHIRNGIVQYRATKNGEEVIFPLLGPLAESIAATVTGDLAFLCTLKRQPWVKESFGAWFAEQCIAAGVPGRAHGLRKAGATFAAQNGANALQLAAMFGWRDPRMAEVYIRKANKMMLAEQAANRLSPHLESGAGARSEIEAKSRAEK